MTPEQRRSVVVACGEAVVDEIAHLDAATAGEALAHAMRWHAIGLEREQGDAAALAWYAGVRKQIDEAEQKLRGYMAKGPNEPLLTVPA